MGKGKQGNKIGHGETEVLIGSKYYDMKDFRHPGGSVIKFYMGKGIDATQAFENFHFRSTKADNYLKSLPSRDADPNFLKLNMLPGQDDLLADFDKLTVDLEKEGFFEPSMTHIAYRITEIILMHVVGLYLVAAGYYWSGIVMLGVVSGRCGWLMHEGGHYSLTGNITIDKSLQILIYGLGCGMSAGWWRSQHNKHHAMPQKIGADVDLDTLPLVAFTSKVVKRAGFSQKQWIKFQAFLFPTVICELVALGWQFFLHPRYIVRTRKFSEALVICSRLVFWHFFFTTRFGIVTSIATYLVYNWIGATYIFTNFAVSHTHLPTVAKDDTQVDWVRYSALHTMNVHPGPFKFVNWWMSYLNFQIEHHLWPSMPQFNHPIVSKRVQKLFAKHGLKYDQRSYVQSMRDTFANLHNVGMDVFYG